MKLSIPAWQDNHYVCLAEILLTIGRSITNMQWRINIAEVAPEPGAEKLEAFDSNTLISTYQLLHMVTPPIQIIDGSLLATIDQETTPCLLIRAIDSTSWDIETNISSILDDIISNYPSATEQ